MILMWMNRSLMNESFSNLFVFQFPPYATNEIGKMGGMNRRELGHGQCLSTFIRHRTVLYCNKILNTVVCLFMFVCARARFYRSTSREILEIRHPQRLPLHNSCHIRSSGIQWFVSWLVFLYSSTHSQCSSLWLTLCFPSRILIHGFSMWRQFGSDGRW